MQNGRQDRGRLAMAPLSEVHECYVDWKEIHVESGDWTVAYSSFHQEQYSVQIDKIERCKTYPFVTSLNTSASPRSASVTDRKMTKQT